MTYADTQASLLVRIRDVNDTNSWGMFVETYTPVVFRYLRRRGLQDADAADVAQEVLIEVARSIQQFNYQPEKGRFRDWLGLITQRRLLRYWQRTKMVAEPRNSPEIQLAAADSEWIEAYQGELLRIAMDRVRPNFEPLTWESFKQTWLDRRPALEVSKELNMTLDLVYSAKSRILKRLEVEIRLLGEDCVWISADR
jgi:RNA polymerase sigma-70 factor, ECF subfamily